MTETWHLHTALVTHIAANQNDHTAKLLKLEFDRLNVQRCSNCSGWGHSPDGCPTGMKLAQFKVGVAEQTTLVNDLRSRARTKYNMGAASGFSLLSGAKVKFPFIPENKKFKKQKGYMW